MALNLALSVRQHARGQEIRTPRPRPEDPEIQMQPETSAAQTGEMEEINTLEPRKSREPTNVAFGFFLLGGKVLGTY